MKINLQIEFKEINHVIITKELIGKNPKIKDSMKLFTGELKKHLEGYFKKNRMKVNIDCVIEDE